MCPLQLCTFSGIAVGPVHFPVEFILLNQRSDCRLDPMVPIAGRLKELGVCSGFNISCWYQVTEPWTLAALSAAWGLCFPQRADDVLKASGQAAVVPAWAPQEGQSGGEKKGLGLSGVVWPMFSPSGTPSGYSRGWHMEELKWNRGRNRVSGPRHQRRAEAISPVLVGIMGKGLWVPCIIQGLGI